MNDFVGNLLAELALFTLLGVLYYFYQKKKIIKFEENKIPFLMGLILQSCLMQRGDKPDPKIDSLIEALDDYISDKTNTPPLSLLRFYSQSPECSEELRDVITESLAELELKNA